MLQVRPALLGHGNREIGIGVSPNQLEWNIQLLQFGQAPGVLRDFVKELRRQLREGRAGAGLLHEIVGDERVEEFLVMSLLGIRKRYLKLLLLPVEQPTELLGASSNRA